MSITAAQLDVILNGTDAGAQAAIGRTESSLNRLEKAAGSAGAAIQKTLGMIGLAADAALAGSVVAAANWDITLNKLAANSTLTAAEIQKLGGYIRTLGDQTGASFEKLAEGARHVSDFGFTLDQTTKILEVATKAAVSTGADVSDTANALAVVLKEFNIGASKSGQVMDILAEAAKRGNMTLADFVATAGPALATTAALHVPLTEAAAAMSTFTEHGFTAARAGTQLTGVLTHIANPSAAAVAELERLSKITGIDLVSDFTTGGLAGKGLAGVMADLHAAVGNDTGEILKLIPAIRGGQGAMILAGAGASDYAANLGLLGDVVAGKLKPMEEAWAKRQGDMDVILNRVKNIIHDMAISIGEVLLPPIARLLNFLSPLIERLNLWTKAHPQLTATILAVVGAVGTLVGGMAVLGPMFSSFALILGPLATILGAAIIPILGIASSAAALFLIWTGGWDGAKSVLSAAWSTISPIFSSLLKTVQDVVKAFSSGGLGGAFTTLVSDLRTKVGPAFLTLGKSVLDALGSVDWAAAGHRLLDLMLAGLQAAGSLGDRILTWVATTLQSINWSQVGSSLLAAGRAIVTALVTAVEGIDWATAWKPVAIAAALALGLALIGPMGTAMAALGSLLAGHLTIMGVNFQNLGATIEAALGPERLATINRFGAALRDGLEPVLVPIKQIWDELVATFTRSGPVLDSLERSWKNLASPEVREALRDVGVLLAALVVIVTAFVEGALSALVQSFGDWLPGALRLAAGAIEMVTSAIHLLADIIIGFVNIITDLVHGDWTRAWEDAKLLLLNVVDDIGGIFHGFFEFLLGGFQATIGAILGFIFGFVQGVDGFLGRMVADSEGKFEDFKTRALQPIQDLHDKIMVVLERLPEEMWQIGEDIVNGLEKGISDRWKDFKSWWADRVGDLDKVAKTVLGISSPSTVFAGIGKSTVEGLQKGWEDNFVSVQTSMATSVTKLTAEGSPVMTAAKSSGAAIAFELLQSFQSTAEANQFAIGGISAINGGELPFQANINKLKITPPTPQGVEPNFENMYHAPVPKDTTPPAPKLPELPDFAPPEGDTAGAADQGWGDAFGGAVDNSLEATLAAMRVKIPKVAQELAALAATFPASMAQAVLDNGGKPSIALFTVLSQAYQRAGDATRGGNAEIQNLLVTGLTDVWNELGQVMSPAAIRAFSGALDTTRNFLRVGSSALAQAFTQNWISQTEALGVPVSDALVRFEEKTTKEFLTRFGSSGQTAANALYTNLTAYITANGAEPSAAIQNALKKMIAAGAVMMGDGGASFGQSFMAANQVWLDQFGTDLPADVVTKIQQAVTRIKPATDEAFQAIIDSITTQFQAVQNLFDQPISLKWANDFTAAAQHIASATGSGLAEAQGLLATFINNTADLTGSLPDGTAVRNYSLMITHLEDATRGGSAAIALLFAGLVDQIQQQLGEPLSAAVTTDLDNLIKRVGPEAATQLLHDFGTGAATGLTAMGTAAKNAGDEIAQGAKTAQTALEALTKEGTSTAVALAKIGQVVPDSLKNLGTSANAAVATYNAAVAKLAAIDKQLSGYLTDEDRKRLDAARIEAAGEVTIAKDAMDQKIQTYNNTTAAFVQNQTEMYDAAKAASASIISTQASIFDAMHANVELMRGPQGPFTLLMEETNNTIVGLIQSINAVIQKIATVTDESVRASLSNMITGPGGLNDQLAAAREQLREFGIQNQDWLNQQAASQASSTGQAAIGGGKLSGGISGNADSGGSGPLSPNGDKTRGDLRTGQGPADFAAYNLPGGGSYQPNPMAAILNNIFADFRQTGNLKAMLDELVASGRSLDQALKDATTMQGLAGQMALDTSGAWVKVLTNASQDFTRGVKDAAQMVLDLTNRGADLNSAITATAEVLKLSQDEVTKSWDALTNMNQATQNVTSSMNELATAQQNLLDKILGPASDASTSNARTWLQTFMDKNQLYDPNSLGRALGAYIPGQTSQQQPAGVANLYVNVMLNGQVLASAVGNGLQHNDRLNVGLV